jgi:hypothetical protein
VEEIELFDFIETLAPACSGFTATIIPNIPEFEIGTTRMLSNPESLYLRKKIGLFYYG